MNISLRYREDRRSLVVVGGTLLIQLLVILMPAEKVNLFSAMGLSLLLGFMGYLCHTINHNHIHIPLFVSGSINNVFSVFLSIAQGLSSKSLIITHNLNHHVELEKPTDWFHSGHAGKGPGIVRLFRYVIKVWTLIAKERKFSRYRLPPKLARMEKIENLGLMVFSLLALVLSWKAFVMVILPAWMISSFLITAINLLQHEGCDASSEFAHSRNYTSRFGNWLFFNGGYHAAHHTKPALHWSRLPEYHQEISGHIPSELNSTSLAAVIFKSYLFNRA